MYQFLTLKECRDLVHLTFQKLGHPELIGQVPIKFSNRMTSTLGKAYRDYKNKGMVFSSPLYKRATREQRIQNIVHEACHIVQFVKYPRSKPHGYEWQSLMIKMGLEPKRCHNVDNSDLKRKRGGTHTVKCGCRTFELGAIRYKRMKAGKRYFCRSCKGTVTEA